MNTCCKINDATVEEGVQFFGLIPLISSSKVWFMDTDGLKIVLNIV